MDHNTLFTVALQLEYIWEIIYVQFLSDKWRKNSKAFPHKNELLKDAKFKICVYNVSALTYERSIFSC